MSISAQFTMQSSESISEMRNNILGAVSKSVSDTLIPFMDRVQNAEQQHNVIMKMLENHPGYVALLEENILLKKQLKSVNNESDGVKINIHDNCDKGQVSVSDIYTEFGFVNKSKQNIISDKKTVVTSLPDAGSAISAKLVDYQRILEDRFNIDDHELIVAFKKLFSDFMQNQTDSEDETSSVELIEPPPIKRQVVDLTNSWLSSASTVKAETNINDPIQARLAENKGLLDTNESEDHEDEDEDDEDEDEDEESEVESEEDEEEEEEEEEEDDQDSEEEEDDKGSEEEEEEEEEEDEVSVNNVKEVANKWDEKEHDRVIQGSKDEESDEETDEEVAPPTGPRTAPSNEESEKAESDSEEELFVLELEDEDGNPVEYYCNDESEMNGDIYEVLPDESPGTKVGVIKDGEIELFE